MPSKKKVVPEKKICPAKIVYIIEYDEGAEWGEEEDWNRVNDLPVFTKLLKTGKLPANTQWRWDDRPFRKKEDAQYLVDAMNASEGNSYYRVGELICR